MLLGQRRLVLFGIGVAAVQLRLRIVRPDRERVAERGDRLLRPAERVERRAAQALRGGEFGVRGERRQGVQRVRRQPGRQLGAGQREPAVPVGRPHRQRPGEQADRLRRATGSEGAFAQQEQGVRIVRLVGDQAVAEAFPPPHAGRLGRGR